jgi:DNA replication licensing factor MCM3
MQIDTSTKATSEDAYKERMRSKISEYMAMRDVKTDITRMVGSSNNRLSVNIDKLRSFDTDLANFVLQRPLDSLNMFEQQLDHAVKDLKDDSLKGMNEKTAARSNDMAFPTKVKKYYVNFDGNFGRNHITPRGLKANLINQLVTV